MDAVSRDVADRSAIDVHEARAGAAVTLDGDRRIGYSPRVGRLPRDTGEA
jgi:hypothetical protein